MPVTAVIDAGTHRPARWQPSDSLPGHSWPVRGRVSQSKRGIGAVRRRSGLL